MREITLSEISEISIWETKLGYDKPYINHLYKRNCSLKSGIGRNYSLKSVYCEDYSINSGNWEKLLSEIFEILISETKLGYDNPYTNHLYMWNLEIERNCSVKSGISRNYSLKSVYCGTILLTLEIERNYSLKSLKFQFRRLN